MFMLLTVYPTPQRCKKPIKVFCCPAVIDPAYDAELLELCKRQQIGLLVPLNDLELPRLAL